MKIHSFALATAWCASLGWLAPTSGARAQTLADIQDKTLPPNSYYNGSDGAGGYTSRGIFFNNSYDSTYGSWSGFSYSNVTDNTTSGYGNQYSAIAGSGAGGSSLYAVAYGDGNFPRITLPAGQDRPLSVSLTNTTYAALSMQNGDSFSKKFGGANGNDPDYFYLTISAFDASNALLGSVVFYLADFRFANNAQDYIVTNWTTVDLSGLGGGVRSLGLSFGSSDTGAFGVNTPTYVAMDNLLIVPEPSALVWLALLGGALAVNAIWRRKRRGGARALPALVVAASAVGALSDAHAGGYSQALNDPTNAYDAPIPGFTGAAGDGAVSGNSVNPAFVGWASAVVDYSPAPGVGSNWNNPSLALGPVTGDYLNIVSLGDLSRSAIDAGTAPGRITLGFSTAIRNGAGADFAVFENSFLSQIDNGVFGELAYVEVSSNGTDFARFPSASLNLAAVGPYGSIDPTNVFGLAGKHVNAGGQSWSTPFDLSALSADPEVTTGKLDLNNVRFVRLVDIPGSGDYKDSSGRPIYDPWLTTDSGGFDLEAVGVLNQVPEPGSLTCGALAAGWIVWCSLARQPRRVAGV